MNAREIAHLLRGKPAGGGNYSVCCPAHKDSRPSLTIKDSPQTGRLLVNCKAGCAGADVIAEFQRLGYLNPIGSEVTAYEAQAHDKDDDELKEKRMNWARNIWFASHKAPGTIVEEYLRRRGFDGKIPETIRFHPALHYPETTERFPGMVSCVGVVPDNKVVAIHRTYLLPDGSGKANLDSPKRMLGDCKGGAVRLGPAGDALLIAEGIETTLSAMKLFGLPGWSGLTANGVEAMILPPSVRMVIICADQDKIVANYPRGVGFAMAERAKARFEAEGREVEIRLPDDGLKDFNDLLMRRLASHCLLTAP